MPRKEKLYAVLSAVALSALVIAGTFAWTNFDASIINNFFGAGTGSGSQPDGPGGTLHNDMADGDFVLEFIQTIEKTRALKLENVNFEPRFFRSRSEIEEFINENIDFFLIGYNEDMHPIYHGFYVSEHFDGDFFNERSLLLIMDTQPSGSHRVLIDEAYINDDGVLMVEMIDEISEMTTDTDSILMLMNIDNSLLSENVHVSSVETIAEEPRLYYMEHYGLLTMHEILEMIGAGDISPDESRSFYSYDNFENCEADCSHVHVDNDEVNLSGRFWQSTTARCTNFSGQHTWASETPWQRQVFHQYWSGNFVCTIRYSRVRTCGGCRLRVTFHEYWFIRCR